MTYGGQVIDPTAYIYIHIYIASPFGRALGLANVLVVVERKERKEERTKTEKKGLQQLVSSSPGSLQL